MEKFEGFDVPDITFRKSAEERMKDYCSFSRCTGIDCDNCLFYRSEATIPVFLKWEKKRERK